MPTEAEKRAIKKYHDKQAGIAIRVTPAQRQAIQDAAADLGVPIKGYIMGAVSERMAKDGRKMP